ncbi:MAG: phosphoribosylformylglycinamidine synthase subunit PurQ [Candidatus Sumerlaeaceae bacterium]|jgi:phosphoribosylformylglycinamidine synthase
MKIAVVQFPGSNCEMDTVRAVSHVLNIKPTLVWHKDRIPPNTDLVILPGGFSYGDYLRAGAIARFSPVMKSVIEYAMSGGLVVGICNGFQILLEAGLLPGAMLPNKCLKFVCKWVYLRTERQDLPFTNTLPKIIHLPIAHGMGNYFIDEEGLTRLEENRQIVFRYCDRLGNTNEAANPNGSISNIAGIVNEDGNVLGMMPHPERAVQEELGGADGASLFRSIAAFLAMQKAS